MNFRPDMIPGVGLLLAGATLTFGARQLCRKPENVNQTKLMGAGLAILGALLVFL